MSATARILSLQLALAAMLLRALLPVGWMPAEGIRDGSWLSICDGIRHDASHVMPDMPGMDAMPGMAMPAHKHHGGAPSIHDICPFAAAAQLAADVLSGPLVVPQRLSWRIAPSHGGQIALPLTARAAHRARAPPVFS